MKTHLKIHIKGQVQGVGFRYNAQKQANRLRISGITRNNKDGSVYIEAEGSLKNLEIFLAWCQKGPKFANVEDIIVNKGKLKNYDRFKILR